MAEIMKTESSEIDWDGDVYVDSDVDDDTTYGGDDDGDDDSFVWNESLQKNLIRLIVD